jgi:geranylgeranyl reductase family protein
MVLERWDAVVVGAGPAGSAVGLSLARAGASVLLLDRATFPRDKPCSEYLSPAATPLLARLDPAFIPEIESASPGRLFGMRIVAPDGQSAEGRFERLSIDSPPGMRPYGFAVPRTVLDSTLLRGAQRAGAVIEEGAQAEELLYDQGSVSGVVVRRPGGERHAVRARVVVGADGLRSIVARRLGLRRRSRPERVAFTAHFCGVAAVGEVGEMHVGGTEAGGGYVGLGPIGDGVTTTALVLPSRIARERAAELRGEPSLIRALDRFPCLRDRFADARMVREVLVTGPFAQWSRASVAPGGGALLVGDAADFFDPFTGQGLYSALLGAELAAQVIVAALADQSRGPLRAAVLAPYAAARRRAFAGKWILERLIGIGVGWPWLAGRVIERLARHPALADLLVGATGNIVPARAVLAPANLIRLLA